MSPGAEITLRAAYDAGGLAPSFQWRLNGQDIAGATRWLLKLTNVGLGDAGEYTIVVRNDEGEATSPPLKLEVDPTFTLFSPLPALKSLNWMGAWADVNHDGWLDLVQTRDPGKHLALNAPDGTFVQVQEIPGTAGSETNPAAFGDYDNDGFVDLALAEFWGNRVQIFHNDGTGHFVLVRQFPAIRPVMLTWVDIEGDGYLDLFQTSEDAGTSEGGRNVLYLNHRGDGTFTPAKQGDPGWEVVDKDGQYVICRTAAWADYDGDGLLDVYLTTAIGQCRLYRGTGPGRFDLQTPLPYWNTPDSMYAAWGDYDNDGDFDLLVTTFQRGTAALLYQNQGDGSLVLMTEEQVGSLVSDAAESGGATWGDYDNDGDLDVYVANTGYSSTAGREANFLYVNQGNSTFARVLTGNPANSVQDNWFANWVDYNNDGFLDLFVSSHWSTSELYRNDLPRNGNANHWLKVRSEGRVSNRDGIGAKIRVKAVIGGQERWLLRQIVSTAAGEPLIAHFGLGDAPKVDLVRIEWPSGIVQELTNVPAEQTLTVTERTELVSLGEGRIWVRCWKGMKYEVEVSGDLTAWASIGVFTNETGRLEVTDADAVNHPYRFYRAIAR